MFDFQDERPLTEEEYQQLKSEIEDCTDGYSNFDLACLILTMENLKTLLQVTKTMYDLELTATQIERDALMNTKEELQKENFVLRYQWEQYRNIAEKENHCKECANYNVGDGIDDIRNCYGCEFSK